MRSPVGAGAGLADLIDFGHPFIANPGLLDRIANGWPLDALNPATIYGGEEQGCTRKHVLSL